MSTTISDLIDQAKRLQQANRVERARLADAYGWPVIAPLETAPATWVLARDRAEKQLGVKLVKFFQSTGATA